MRNKIAEIGGKSARNRGFKTPHADANSRQDVYYILGNVLHGRLIRSGHLWGSNIFSNHIKFKSILECSRKPHSFLFKGDWNKNMRKMFYIFQTGNSWYKEISKKSLNQDSYTIKGNHSSVLHNFSLSIFSLLFSWCQLSLA